MNEPNTLDEQIRKAVKDGLSNHTGEFANPWIFKKSYSHEELADILNDIMASERLFKNLEALFTEHSKVDENTSDGYHTFKELYDYRRVYNQALFNEWASQGKYDVHKSWKHSDGKHCFGGGWFVVVAQLPTGQITNHYQEEYWQDFEIPELPYAAGYDGHTPKEALNHLTQLKRNKGEDNE